MATITFGGWAPGLLGDDREAPIYLDGVDIGCIVETTTEDGDFYIPKRVVCGYEAVINASHDASNPRFMVESCRRINNGDSVTIKRLRTNKAAYSDICAQIVRAYGGR